MYHFVHKSVCKILLKKKNAKMTFIARTTFFQSVTIFRCKHALQLRGEYSLQNKTNFPNFFSRQ